MHGIANESNFNVDNGTYVVKFWATWCQPCKVMEPTILKLEVEFPNISFLSVDVDQVPILAKSFKIKTVPTLLIIKNDIEVNRVEGLSLITPLRSLLKKSSDGGENINVSEIKKAV